MRDFVLTMLSCEQCLFITSIRLVLSKPSNRSGGYSVIEPYNTLNISATSEAFVTILSFSFDIILFYCFEFISDSMKTTCFVILRD